MNTNLAFTLKIKILGIEDDGITPKRIPYIGIEMANGTDFSTSTHDKIVDLLTNNTIQYEKVERTDNIAPHFQIPIDDMYKSIRLLEDNSFIPFEVVPNSIITYLKKSLKREMNRPADDEIKDKLGSELWDKLRPFQQTAVRKSVTHQKMFIADPMGAGKTLESICMVKYYEDHWPALVVCPSILRSTWKNELVKWLGIDPDDIAVVKATKCITSGKIPKNHKFLIISYSLLFKPHVFSFLTRKKYDTVILDESHYIKSRDSKRSMAAIKIISKAAIRVLISGTPFSYPSEMYQQIKALYPEIYPRFFNSKLHNQAFSDPLKFYFASRYCSPAPFRVHGAVQWEFKGYVKWMELNSLLSTFMIRRKKKANLNFLAPIIRNSIILESLKPNKLKEISKLLTGAKKPKKQPKDGIESKSPDKMMEAWRLTCSYKIPMVLQFIKQYIIDDILQHKERNNVLIFFHHAIMRQEIQVILDAAHVEYLVIDGSTSQEKRKIYQDDFQNTDKYRVALLSITACATGLTLTRANVAVFTEIMFSPEVVLQAEARIHRISQLRHVNIFYLLSPNTNDDINLGLITKKERKSSEILDGEQNQIYSKRIKIAEQFGTMNDFLVMPPGENIQVLTDAKKKRKYKTNKQAPEKKKKRRRFFTSRRK
jgi:SWI/SNF-related matrix-associated actin-dependent regulator 1 of chromatin subfamily A